MHIHWITKTILQAYYIHELFYISLWEFFLRAQTKKLVKSKRTLGSLFTLAAAIEKKQTPQKCLNASWGRVHLKPTSSALNLFFFVLFCYNRGQVLCQEQTPLGSPFLNCKSAPSDSHRICPKLGLTDCCTTIYIGRLAWLRKRAYVPPPSVDSGRAADLAGLLLPYYGVWQLTSVFHCKVHLRKENSFVSVKPCASLHLFFLQ